MFLLDTNVIAETKRRSPHPNVMAWFDRVDAGVIFLSVLTLGEITKGAELLAGRDPRAAASLRSWLDGIRRSFASRIVGIDGEIAEIWGRMSARRPLPVIDSLIAATAVVRDLTLVTRNLHDVAGMGARTVDPWET